MNPQDFNPNPRQTPGFEEQEPPRASADGQPCQNQQPNAPFFNGYPNGGPFPDPYQIPYQGPYGGTFANPYQGPYQAPYGGLYGAPSYYVPHPPVYRPAPPSSDGYDQSLISLLLGIICILCFWIPFYYLLTTAGGICGIVFSALGRGKSRRTYGTPASLCTAALIVCIIGVALSGANMFVGVASMV